MGSKKAWPDQTPRLTFRTERRGEGGGTEGDREPQIERGGGPKEDYLDAIELESNRRRSLQAYKDRIRK